MDWTSILSKAGKPCTIREALELAGLKSTEYNSAAGDLHSLAKGGMVHRWAGESGEFLFSSQPKPEEPFIPKVRDDDLPQAFREPPEWQDGYGPEKNIWTTCLPYAPDAIRGPKPGACCGWACNWLDGGKAFPMPSVENMSRTALYFELRDAYAQTHNPEAGRLLLELGADPSSSDRIILPNVKHLLNLLREHYVEAVSAWSVSPRVMQLTWRPDWKPRMQPGWKVERGSLGIWTLFTETGEYPLHGEYSRWRK